MILSQYDYQMYLDEAEGLKEEMNDLLVSMELYHQSHSLEEFNRWWSLEGREQRYFACKGRVERIMNLLSIAEVVEEEHPKMRRGGTAARRYGKEW